MSATTVIGVEEAVARMGMVGMAMRADIRDATKHAALDTQTLAKRLCPVDTGRLRSSIEYRDIGDWAYAEVFTDVEYAAYVEFGTTRQAAQPYLAPAWESIRPYYLADLAKILGAGGIA